MWFWLLVVTLVGAAAWMADRALLAAERRGWIYWRKRSASPSAMGNALLEMQQMVDPGSRAVLEAQRQEIDEREDAGEPPDPRASLDATSIQESDGRS